MSLALPLVALYEGSVWSVRWVEKRAAAERAASESGSRRQARGVILLRHCRA
jgi:Sec-independent protein secretion pathway component TatC